MPHGQIGPIQQRLELIRRALFAATEDDEHLEVDELSQVRFICGLEDEFTQQHTSVALKFLSNKAHDARAQLRALVDFSVLLFTKGADIIHSAQAAGAGDPDVAALWQLGDARRYATCEKVVAGIVQRQELRNDIDPAQAIDILWTLCGAETYSLFVARRGWSARSFGDWLYRTLLQQLLNIRSSHLD